MVLHLQGIFWEVRQILWFSWCLGVATSVQSLGHPDASCPAVCRAVLSQKELPHILQDFQMSCWKCRSPRAWLWLPEPVSQANANYSMPVLKKHQVFYYHVNQGKMSSSMLYQELCVLFCKLWGLPWWPSGWDCASSAAGMVQSLIRKLRSHVPHSTAKNKN